MERLKEIKEKGVDSVTADDIPIGLGVITEFMNTNAEAQSIIKELDMKGNFDIRDADNYVLTVTNGKAEYEQKGLTEGDFTMTTDLKTITAVLIGDTDVSVEFLKGSMVVDGDFEKMVAFFQAVELAYDALGFVKEGDAEHLIDAKTMRRLYDVYMAGATDIDPNDIPLIFDIFCTFANLNDEAQEILAEEEITVQMLIKDVGAYVVRVKDNVASWSKGEIDDHTLQFEIALNVAADVFLSGDAASAFLAGDIEASGNIAEALVLQDLIDTFLEILPFTDTED